MQTKFIIGRRSAKPDDQHYKMAPVPIVHPTIESAVTEAERLAGLNIGDTFVIFQAVKAIVGQQAAPTFTEVEV